MATNKRAAAKRPRAQRPAALTTEAGGSPVAPKGEAPKGPRRRIIPDGKRPHDPVTYGGLIELGLIESADLDTDDGPNA